MASNAEKTCKSDGNQIKTSSAVVDTKDVVDDAYEKLECSFKSLTDVGKYSYTALCAIALNKLYEQEECDKYGFNHTKNIFSYAFDRAIKRSKFYHN